MAQIDFSYLFAAGSPILEMSRTPSSQGPASFSKADLCSLRATLIFSESGKACLS